MVKILRLLPLTTLIIIFFFVCGGLYLIGFWMTFDVDVSNFVSLTDIPKSFLLPSAVVHGLFILLVGFAPFASLTWIHIIDLFTTSKPKPQTENFKYLYACMWLAVWVCILVVALNYFQNSSYYWLISGLTLSGFLMNWVRHVPNIRLLFPSRLLRVYVMYLAVFAPIMSFAVGKARSVNIYNNKAISKISVISKNGESIRTNEINLFNLKFIGFLGNKTIASTLNNDSLFFLNDEEFRITIIANSK